MLRYDGATGDFIDEFVAPEWSGQLSSFRGLTFGLDGRLYVTENVSDSVLRYDGATGDFVDEFVSPGSAGLY